jgi:hypothetical protein
VAADRRLREGEAAPAAQRTTRVLVFTVRSTRPGAPPFLIAVFTKVPSFVIRSLTLIVAL